MGTLYVEALHDSQVKCEQGQFSAGLEHRQMGYWYLQPLPELPLWFPGNQ